MEFYYGGKININGTTRFNSQRDGILLFASFSCSIVGSGFNSQRDGILPFWRLPFIMKFTRFQFPTGWNSTKGFLLLGVLSDVSIPNGMEFYTKWRSVAPPYRCFNSQRDGILPFWRLPFIMKFTRFQFPTGWNSTKGFLLLGVLSDVSIPNGMEFYTKWRSVAPPHRCFNSQRDGILPVL